MQLSGPWPPYHFVHRSSAQQQHSAKLQKDRPLRYIEEKGAVPRSWTTFPLFQGIGKYKGNARIEFLDGNIPERQEQL